VKEKSPTTDEMAYLKVGQELTNTLKWDTLDALYHPPLTYYVHGYGCKLSIIPEGGEGPLFCARLMMQPFALLLGVFFSGGPETFSV